jgi:hypothetical protein
VTICGGRLAPDPLCDRQERQKFPGDAANFLTTIEQQSGILDATILPALDSLLCALTDDRSRSYIYLSPWL